MKTISLRNFAAGMLALISVWATLVSFTPPEVNGGESFEIYVDKKLVLRHYVSYSKEPQTFTIDKRNANSQVDVYYNHCGKLGKARHLTIRDGQNKILKQWNFNSEEKFMSFNVKDLNAITKGHEKLSLYYSADELPKGRFLASVVVTGDNSTNP